MTRLLAWPLGFLRLLIQSMGLALGQIWANKVRSTLTMIGIVIGVASVTAVIAALTGLKTHVLKEFETLGARNIYVFSRWPRTGPQRHASWRTIRLTPELFDHTLENCPSLQCITRYCGMTETVKYGDVSVENVSAYGMDPSWQQAENRRVQLGRSFSLVEAAEGANVCLIDPSLREKLHLDEDCIGQRIQMENQLYVIIGLLEPRTTSMFGAGQGGEGLMSVYMPFPTLYRIAQYMGVIATIRSAEQSDEARAELRFYLRRVRCLSFDMPDNFRLNAVEEVISKFQEVATVITMIAGGVVAISLLVGGVGIMNIMLVSVSERTREIGLRKAVGAPPSAILLQFLVEAVTLCLLGGLIGLLLGRLLTGAVVAAIPSTPGMAPIEAPIPLWAVALAFGFSAAVGVVFGMFPAIKAARLDPMEALRHE